MELPEICSNSLISDIEIINYRSVIRNFDIELHNLRIIGQMGQGEYSFVYSAIDIVTNIIYAFKITKLNSDDLEEWIKNLEIVNNNPEIFPILYLGWIGDVRIQTCGFSLQQILSGNLYYFTRGDYPYLFTEPMLLDVLRKCVLMNERRITVNGSPINWMLDHKNFSMKYVDFKSIEMISNTNFCRRCLKGGNFPPDVELQTLLSSLIYPEFLSLCFDILLKVTSEPKIIQCCNYLIKAIKEYITPDRVLEKWRNCLEYHHR